MFKVGDRVRYKGTKIFNGNPEYGEIVTVTDIKEGKSCPVVISVNASNPWWMPESMFELVSETCNGWEVP